MERPHPWASGSWVQVSADFSIQNLYKSTSVLSQMLLSVSLPTKNFSQKLSTYRDFSEVKTSSNQRLGECVRSKMDIVSQWQKSMNVGILWFSICLKWSEEDEWERNLITQRFKVVWWAKRTYVCKINWNLVFIFEGILMTAKKIVTL